MNPPPGPDPERGLYETVLLAAGKPVALRRHLDRLAASARELYGAELPVAELTAAAAERARGHEYARLRIEVAPVPAGKLSERLTVTPLDPAQFFPPRERGAELRSFTPPQWTGEHKLADRSWLEQTERELGADEVPLIVDPGGGVLEAGRANVFAVRGGVLLTPPLDGRILPGTARGAVLELAAELGIETEQRRLSLADLRGAEEVFLTSSLRGIRPARSLDGEALGESDAVSGRLATALRRRWLG